VLGSAVGVVARTGTAEGTAAAGAGVVAAAGGLVTAPVRAPMPTGTPPRARDGGTPHYWKQARLTLAC